MKRGILAGVAFFFYSASLCLAASQDVAAVEMRVKKVLLDPSTRNPTAVVLLESTKGKRVMPIWIGSEEATSIAIELEKMSIPRPNTHDLIRNILQGVGASIHHITITDLRNNIYYANISLRLKGQEFRIDSRPSDAIAVALRMKAPIFASARVLAKAKTLPATEEAREGLQKRLGLHLQDLNADLASLLDLRVKQGVLVADVDAGSPGFEAGIQRGDIILKANDRPVKKVGDLESFFQEPNKPARLKLELLRKGKSLTVVLGLSSSS